MERTIVGIDVGTTKVCTLVGEVSEDESLRIVGVGTVPSRGIRKGVIVNVAEATQAIRASVEKAERVSGYEIQRAHVSLAGAHVTSMNSRGVIAVQHGERGISPEEVDRAMEAARAIAIPHDREVVHIIPRGYTVDGQEGIRDPVGMVGFRLEVEAHIITGAVSSIHNLMRVRGRCRRGRGRVGARSAGVGRGCAFRHRARYGRGAGGHWRRHDRHRGIH